MAIYDWRGRNNRGEPVDGQIDAMTEGGVADQLKTIGVVPVYIALAKAVAEAKTDNWFDRLNRKPVIDEDLMIYAVREERDPGHDPDREPGLERVDRVDDALDDALGVRARVERERHLPGEEILERDLGACAVRVDRSTPHVERIGPVNALGSEHLQHAKL